MAINGSDALVRTLLIGFVAGAIAVVTFHQVTVLILGALKLIGGSPYSMRPVAPFGVPTILNQMFWGGLWGSVFAAIFDRLPRTLPLWVIGLVFGWLGPVLVGWFVVAPIKGLPMANGFAVGRMWPSLVINGMFGIGVALIFTFLRGKLSGPRPALRA